MNKYKLLIGILIILVSCNKPSKSVRFTILLDHAITDKKLTDNDTLVKLIEPFYYHDTLIAPIINFERIDIAPVAHDSIRNEGIIKALNEWMSGNKKNAQKIEKQLNIAIKKFGFKDAFTLPSNNLKYTDSIIVNQHKTNAIIFTNQKNNYGWVASEIKVFDTIDIIHDHIGDLVFNNKNDNGHIFIYYKPTKLEKINIVVAESDPDSDKDGVPDSKDNCKDQRGPLSNNGCPVVTKPLPPHKTPPGTKVPKGKGLTEGTTGANKGEKQ